MATTLLDEALALAALDIPVFPLRITDKRPVVAGGFKAATTDPDTIARMFADPAAGLIGVPCGPASGFDAIDIDVKRGGLEWLAANEPRLPKTRRHYSRSGGVHLLLQHSPGMRTKFDRIAPGVEVRGEGGYIAWWPAMGFAAEGDTWTPWPDWLLIEAMKGRRNPDAAPLAPEELAPPSAEALISLLNDTPNPERMTRGDYVAMNLAVAGCIRALAALDRCDDETAEAIKNAAAEWCARWDSGRAADAETELSRWERDWDLRTNDISGWRHVLALADRCGFDTGALRHDAAVAEFGSLPDDAATATAAGDLHPSPVNLAPAESTSAPLILDEKAPLDSARILTAREYTRDGLRTLHHYAGQFWRWTGTHYVVRDDHAVRAAAYRFLDGAWQQMKGGGYDKFNPDNTKVTKVVDALKAHAHMGDIAAVPAWLDGAPSDAPPSADLIACGNGLLHIGSRRLLPHSPALFNQYALAYAYQADAPAPGAWLRFLGQLWGDDAESTAALQEIFGLLLTPDTTYQKIFYLVGPKRSGKGTIARVLKAIVGDANVAAPTMHAFGSNFGLQSLIGKLVAIVGDARFDSKVDVGAVAVKLLSISGEDTQTIDRKYLDPWTGILATRFVLMSNELPRLHDASGALAGRFVLLQTRRSFYGQEDNGLTARLLGELPAILNWSLAGLDRLRARGYFVQPASAREALDDLEKLTSPIKAFLDDRCIVEPDQSVECGELYTEWRGWCREQGRAQPGTASLFSRDLRAALPELQTVRPRGRDGARSRAFAGVGLAIKPTAANDTADLAAFA